MPTRQASLPPVLMINYPEVCIFNELNEDDGEEKEKEEERLLITRHS